MLVLEVHLKAQSPKRLNGWLSLGKILCVSLSAIAIMALSHVAAESEPAAPNLVLLNGKIFTSDASHPYVQALAIREGRITATGDSVKIGALAGPHTKQIDLGGRTVIPGINDANNHISILPPNRMDLELKSPDPDWPETKAAIAAAELKAPKGTFIYGDIGRKYSAIWQ